MGGTRIAGLGHFAPAQIVANAEIEAGLGVPDGWIVGRTGIRTRRWAAPDEALTDIALPAAEMALRQAALDPARIGLTLLATSTPDHLLPPSAPLLAHRLGLKASGAVDLTGACAGFLYALALADGFVRSSGMAVLIVAANILSRRIDPADRTTAALFADAAGALVLAPCDRADAGVRAVALRADGAGYELIRIPAGGSRTPFAPDAPPGLNAMVMADGRAVFAKAVAMMVEAARDALARAGISATEVDHFVPHQANARIIDAVGGQLGLAPSQILSTVAEFGNSSAATIPFTLSYLGAARGYRRGETLLLAAAGAGLTGGALVYGL